MAEPDAQTAPKPPPNLRVATDEGKECDSCSYYDRGKCNLPSPPYNHLAVDGEWVCDKWEKGDKPDTDSGPPAKNLKQAEQKALRVRRAAKAQADADADADD